MSRHRHLLFYVSLFTLMYAGITAMLVAVALLGGIDLRGSGSFAALAVAALAVADRFVRDHGRPPGTAERGGLVVASLIASLLVALLGGVGLELWLGEADLATIAGLLLAALRTPVVAGAVLLMLALAFAALWFFYGWFAHRQARAWDRRLAA